MFIPVQVLKRMRMKKHGASGHRLECDCLGVSGDGGDLRKPKTCMYVGLGVYKADQGTFLALFPYSTIPSWGLKKKSSH